MNNYRHESSGTTNKIMRRILSGTKDDGTRKYNILLSLGRSWKDKTYMNTDTGNTFKGEPSGIVTAEAMPFSKGRLKWGITYTFTGYRRNVFVNKNGRTVRYGEDNMSMDRLFYILVNKFNYGEDFVQKYLDEVAPQHLGNQIKEVIEPVLDAFEERVLNQNETVPGRETEAKGEEEIAFPASTGETKNDGVSTGTESSGVFKKIKAGLKTFFGEAKAKLKTFFGEAKAKLASFYDDLENGKVEIKGKTWEAEGERLASLLKADFVSSMNTGIVPLSKTFLAKSTRKKRIALGFDGTTVFSASSQFVKSIQFKVRIQNV